MSRTRRIYNFPNRGVKWYHPYSCLCMGNCHYCKDLTKSTKKRRLKMKYEFLKNLKDELAAV